MRNALGMPSGDIGTESEWFSPNGQNAGFTCHFKGYPKKKAGFGSTLADPACRFRQRVARGEPALRDHIPA